MSDETIECSPSIWTVRNCIVSSMNGQCRDVITQITNKHTDRHDSRVEIFPQATARKPRKRTFFRQRIRFF